MKAKIALPVLLGACLLAPAARAAGLQITFCPEQVARPYPLDSLRGVQSLLLQNVAIANIGEAPVTLRRVEIELLKAGTVMDRRILDTTALAAAAKSGKGAKDAGMMDLYAFQFCDGKLLGKHSLATDATLAPGHAVLVMQQPFAWKGARDELRVRATAEPAGDATTAEATLRIDPGTSRTVFRWPLEGGPWTIAGASFHGTHRWGIPEEFALDIVKVGADGRSFRTKGASNEDFHAYGAEVVAAAPGTVAAVISGAKELPPLLRQPGESMQDYYGRISAQQVKNMADGDKGSVGESVILDHGQSEYSIYAHLQPGSIAVKPGDQVTAGQGIGRLGTSGNSTEPHLHFQVCDRPSALSCAGVVPTFEGIEVLNADGPRPLQTGDVVRMVQ
jgi:murein DD-endopeptidase MepM/ murein hydrolase activator NlpD